MAKIIAFCGSPASGKTSIAMKTAMEVYCSTKDEKVVFLSPDLNVPSIGLLFPNYNPDEVCSLSKTLDNTDISTESIIENAVTVKSMKDFLCLGFKAGDSKYSFPAPTEDKITALFSSLNEISGYVFVDCSSDEADAISQRALITADVVVRLVTPDLKGMAWLSSHKKMPDRTEDNDLFNIVNMTDKDLFNPVEEIHSKLNTVLVVLPYSHRLKQQMLDGRMSERFNDKQFNKKIKTIAERMI